MLEIKFKTDDLTCDFNLKISTIMLEKCTNGNKNRFINFQECYPSHCWAKSVLKSPVFEKIDEKTLEEMRNKFESLFNFFDKTSKYFFDSNLFFPNNSFSEKMDIGDHVKSSKNIQNIPSVSLLHANISQSEEIPLKRPENILRGPQFPLKRTHSGLKVGVVRGLLLALLLAVMGGVAAQEKEGKIIVN